MINTFIKNKKKTNKFSTYNPSVNSNPTTLSEITKNISASNKFLTKSTNVFGVASFDVIDNTKIKFLTRNDEILDVDKCKLKLKNKVSDIMLFNQEF